VQPAAERPVIRLKNNLFYDQHYEAKRFLKLKSLLSRSKKHIATILVVLKYSIVSFECCGGFMKFSLLKESFGPARMSNMKESAKEIIFIAFFNKIAQLPFI
jgi:hypothetical protein